MKDFNMKLKLTWSDLYTRAIMTPFPKVPFNDKVYDVNLLEKTVSI